MIAILYVKHVSLQHRKECPTVFESEKEDCFLLNKTTS